MYICCMTRMLLNANGRKGATCTGEPSLIKTHCIFCEYWKEREELDANGIEEKIEESYEEEAE